MENPIIRKQYNNEREVNIFIIGLGHRKNVGKDTAARFLASQYRLHCKGSNVVIKGFAWKLKEICYDLYRWAGLCSPEYYEINPDRKSDFLIPLNKTVRDIWIEMGNKVRDIYEATWLEYLLSGVQADLLIITDVHYPNEAQAIKAKGGFVIKIDRPNISITHDIADDALSDYNEWDAIITASDLKTLYSEIISISEKLLIMRLK